MPESNGERALRQQLRQARAELERGLRADEDGRAEQIFARYLALAADADSALEIIYSTEFTLRELHGEEPTPEEYYTRFPQHRQGLEELFRLHKLVGGAEEELDAPDLLDLPVEGGTDWGVEHFQVLEALGQHGPVAVVKARQLSRDRLVAVKLFSKGQTPPEEVDRFRRGRDDQARLSHPHIVRVYDRGEDEDDVFFTMELGEGGTLARRIGGGPLPADEAARLLHALAGAVQYAHDQKIIHRDLKPANVVLAADGTPKITDFGLAKRLEAESGPTRTGHLLGTPPYMAPEQADGRAEVDERTDIYGLGAVLYEMLTGRPPLQGENDLDTLLQVRRGAALRPRRHNPAADRRLESVCLKCLEKDRRRRYGSAQELADDLGRWLEGRRPRAHGLPPRLGRWVRGHPVACAAALLCLCAAAILPILQYFQDPERWFEHVRQEVRGGRSAVLIGETGPPRRYRWLIKPADVKVLTAPDGAFTVQTFNTAVLEILPDPGLGNYCFRAEVRHDEFAEDAEVGLGFAHSRCAVRDNTIHCLGVLKFNDLADQGRFLNNYVQPTFQRNIESRDNVGPFRQILHKGKVLPHAQGGAAPGGPQRWRTLAVKATPTNFRLYWMGEHLADVPRARLSEEAQFLAAHPPHPLDVLASPDFQDTLTLFIFRARASFRRCVLEPCVENH